MFVAIKQNKMKNTIKLLTTFIAAAIISSCGKETVEKTTTTTGATTTPTKTPLDFEIDFPKYGQPKEVICLPKFSYTPSGKIDRIVTRKQYLDHIR
jgi:acyl-CoA synthetase (AMP-forming)/AMP-acid ligase II